MSDPKTVVDEHSALAEFWEKVDLLVSLAVILVVTPPIAQMIADAWESGGVVRTSVFAVQELAGVSYQEFILFGLAAYVALVCLLLLDEMKRVQGVLLVLCSGIGFAALRSQGVLYPLYVLENVPALVAGFTAAFVLGGGLSIKRSEPPYEFRRVTIALFWIVTVILTVCFVERHLVYENPLQLTADGGVRTAAASAQVTLAGTGLVTDFVLTSAFVAGAYMFTSYEGQTDVFTIGGQRFGKTLLSGLLTKSAADTDGNTPLNPTDPLSKLITSLHRPADERNGDEYTGPTENGEVHQLDSGWGDDEYTGPTEKGEYHRLGFRTRAGTLFKEYVEMDTIDYAGEYLDDELAEQVGDIVPRSRLSTNWLVYVYESLRGLSDLPERAEGLDSEQIQRTLAKQIVHADTLVLLVDSGSLVPQVPYGADDYDVQKDLTEYLDTYVQILRHVDESVLADKDVVVVASKADYLYQLYRTSNTHLTFFNWVNFHLLETENGREKLRPLVNQTQVDRIYPVYYELDHEASTEAGEPVPKRPITGHGNDELLVRITEGR